MMCDIRECDIEAIESRCFCAKHTRMMVADFGDNVEVKQLREVHMAQAITINEQESLIGHLKGALKAVL